MAATSTERRHLVSEHAADTSAAEVHESASCGARARVKLPFVLEAAVGAPLIVPYVRVAPLLHTRLVHRCVAAWHDAAVGLKLLGQTGQVGYSAGMICPPTVPIAAMRVAKETGYLACSSTFLASASNFASSP